MLYIKVLRDILCEGSCFSLFKIKVFFNSSIYFASFSLKLLFKLHTSVTRFLDCGLGSGSSSQTKLSHLILILFGSKLFSMRKRSSWTHWQLMPSAHLYQLRLDAGPGILDWAVYRYLLHTSSEPQTSSRIQEAMQKCLLPGSEDSQPIRSGDSGRP